MGNIQGNTRKLRGACRAGNIEVVEEILGTRQVDINARDYDGDTPLTSAVKNGHLNIVRRLLQHPGVDVNAPGAPGGWTPLIIAVMREYLDIVRTLLDVPALQLGRCNNDGNTALHIACRLPSKVIIPQRWSSIGSNLSPKDVFYKKFSSIEGHLPSNVTFHQSLSIIVLFQ